MLERLRQFLDDLTGAPPDDAAFGEQELRLASAALLVHVAEIDGNFSGSEHRALALLLQQRFDLDAGGAEKLIAAAQKSDREAIDLHHFTSQLQRAMNLPARRRLVEMMWTVAYADVVADEFEENIIWRVSELIGVPSRDRIALRRKVRADSGCDPDAPAPWDVSDEEGKSGA